MPSQINASNSGFGGIVSTGDSSGVLELQTTGTTAVTIDTSQKVGFVAGTAAAPAITRTGDTNTGMFFPAADTIAFAEGGAESMRIDSSGNLLVGDTVQSGSAKLTVKQTVDTTIGGVAIVATDGNGANLSRLTDGALTFRNGGAERMRITSGGSICMNTTTPNSTFLSTAAVLTVGQWGLGPTLVYGNFYISNSSGVGVQLTSGSTSWAALSDERTKTDLKPIENAADKVATLRAVTGRYIKDEDTVSRAFLIAQDVEKVLPEAVAAGEDEDITLQLKYTEVIPLLVAAIKELTERVKELEAK